MKFSNTQFIILILLFACSCKKYLDAKSVQSLSTPQTLEDLQALADNTFLNHSNRMVNNMSDEYYIEPYIWQVVGKEDQDSYVWDKNLNAFGDWRDLYGKIFHTNTILDNLEKVDGKTNQTKWNAIKGSALYFRSGFFYELSQLYAPQYDQSNALLDLGIPLRLNSDFNILSTRSTLQQTYDQITNDLITAADLLPDVAPTTTLYKYRPTKIACYGMLAKTYLQMGNYGKALEFSDKCLNAYSYLLDFNNPSIVNPGSLTPFKPYNAEIIFYQTSNGPISAYSISLIDSVLYRSYADNDLRKKVYFDINPDGTPYYKGPYSGTTGDLFTGIAVDEIYLIRAECAARLNNGKGAVADINKLLSLRWVTGTFTPYSATLPINQILSVVLKERQKELINRGTRWSDLRRLNKEPGFSKIIKRNIDNKAYVLNPGDFPYTLLIPIEVTSKSTLKQNPR